MEKSKGLTRRDLFRTTAIGITVAGLNAFSSEAFGQNQKDVTAKDVVLVQKKANEHHLIQRFNRAEATSLSFKECFGIDSPLLPRVAAGFGGGFGLKGSICGVLMGSIMAVGMKFGRNDIHDTQALQTVNTKVQKLLQRFDTEFGSRNCHELAGYRLEDQEQFKKWVESGGVKRCNAMLRRTVQVLFDEFLV